MIKKNPLAIAIISFLLFFIAYKTISFFILNSEITHNDAKPKIKLSQLITISEARISYSQSFYINNNFVGFNAFIDGKHYVTITKLGKASDGYKIINTTKKPDTNTNISLFDRLGDVELENSRYLNLGAYPFNTRTIYYHADKEILNVNKTKFYEIEATFSFFNLSFNGETSKDFGYGSFKKNKESISFIAYKGDLFVLNLYPIGNAEYKSLHTLSERKI